MQVLRIRDFRNRTGVEGAQDLALDVGTEAPSLAGLLHLLVGELLGAEGDELMVVEAEFAEEGIEGLGAKISAVGIFHRDLLNLILVFGQHLANRCPLL